VARIPLFDGNTKLILNALSSTGMPSTSAGTDADLLQRLGEL
jgi:hypothetical protein